MKKANMRACIYPKDIERITGKSSRNSRMIFTKIKLRLKKDDSQFITIQEFAEYTGINEEIIKSYIY